MKKILIAFSGGPDSVYLYYYLKKKGYNLAICYVNHNVRKDVQNDIKFVENFAEKENIPFVIESIKLKNFNEDIARKKRYEILEKNLKKLNYDVIATGHNKNDNVETLIFRLIRGTGIDGLKGIPKKRGNIIRPILHISKQEILKYLKENNIDYLVDYTNNTLDYSRNIIRHKILPTMKEINENYLDNISRFIELINENNNLKIFIKEELVKYGIKYSKNKIDEIYNIKDKNGASIKLNEKYIWYKGYNFFGIKKINKIEKTEKEIVLKLGENLIFNSYQIIYTDNLILQNELEKKGYKLYNVGVANNIKIRSRRNGDRLDNTKLKKILTDKKIDALEKDLLPIILVEDKIVMVADIKYSKMINKTLIGSRYIAIKKGE